MFTENTVIGLEIHTELATKSKLFCSCATQGNEEPNTRTCPICLGHPGTKPTLNKRALDYGIKMCLALKCDIADELVFSRKSYFYPDLSKNYQITQYEKPLGLNGEMSLSNKKKIGIKRVHLEEDPAALIHPHGIKKSSYVLVDYNRSGNPLAEIVTEPDMKTPEEARDFMKQLITVLEYLRVYNGGIIKADANISIKESGYTRVEIKNITGFKEIERALTYEIERQRKTVNEGHTIKQETRGWDSTEGKTYSMRTKETEDDYGYIVEPDLAIIEITQEMMASVNEEMPELAQEKRERFVTEYKIDKTDAEIIASELLLAELFEKVARRINPVIAARWMRRELLRVMNYNKKTMYDLEIDENHLIELLGMVEKKEISDPTAQKLMEKLIEKPFDVRKYVEENELFCAGDDEELRKYCAQAMEENKKAVEEYKAGKEKALHALVGSVMRKTKGTATPQKVSEKMKEMLS